MRALTFRERMREEAARLAAVENTDPGGLRSSACAAELIFLMGWSGLALRRC